jgi:hypothetical protein
MAIAKFNDIDFNQETLTKVVATIEAPNSLKNKIKQDKFLVIDFKDADPSKLNLEGLEKGDVQCIVSEILGGDIKVDRHFFGEFIKYVEYPNEEILWNFLVDDRKISDELYQKNTYDENLDIAFKFL